MSTFQGKGYQVGIGSGTAAMTIAFFDATGTATLTGWVTSNLDPQSMSVTHGADVQQVRNHQGEVVATIAVNENLEISVTYIPEGATVSAARANMALPLPNTKVTLANMPTVAIGSFSNALNGDFLYEGGATKNGDNAGGPWTVTAPLKKYAGLTPGAQLS